MARSDPVIDEYVLAAFLAGTLPESRREEVVEFLGRNRDAREVLHMASEALVAAQSADDAELARSLLQPWADRPRRKATERASAVPRSRLHGAGRYVAATLVVFVIGMVLRLAFGPPTDALRSPVSNQPKPLSVSIDPAGPALEWPAVENAYRYRLVVWDPLEARVVGQYETPDSKLDSEHTVIRELRGIMRHGNPYAVRVDALDPQNRLIRSSETLNFTYE